MLAIITNAAPQAILEGSYHLAGLVDVDATAIVQFALFIALVLVLPKLIFRPLIARFELREARTDGARAEAKKMLKEADDKEAAYQEATAREKQRALAERANARNQAQRKAAALIADVRAETNAKIDAGIATMREQAAAARAELDTEASQIADLIAHQLLEGHQS